jgi:Protein of unknown function (DUF3105)
VANAKPTKPDAAGSSPSRRDKLASFEAARRKEQRRRSLALLGICLVLAMGLLAYPVYLYAKDYQARNATIEELGVSLAQAGCDPVNQHAASGNQQHVEEGTKVDYSESPPDSGAHYASPAPFTKHFYTADDRPAVETLVHNLEHGYTVVWYRSTLPAEQVDDLEAISRTFDSEQYDPADKFIASPWSEADGEFPAGKNLVLTRWYADPADPANPAKQQGVRQACTAVSGAAIKDYMAKYPSTSAPEPNAA